MRDFPCTFSFIFWPAQLRWGKFGSYLCINLFDHCDFFLFFVISFPFRFLISGSGNDFTRFHRPHGWRVSLCSKINKLVLCLDILYPLLSLFILGCNNACRGDAQTAWVLGAWAVVAGEMRSGEQTLAATWKIDCWPKSIRVIFHAWIRKEKSHVQ